MPSFRLLLIAPLSLALAGCGILYKQPIYQGNLMEKEAVDQLRPGLSKQQVAGLLGTPSIADPFHAQRWDYSASQRTNRRGDVEIKTLTLHFENDSLARWEGDYFPEQDEQLARNSLRQFGPNLVKEKDKRGGR
ncbi:hypothetical protein CSC62_08950 [Pseudoxanthomonas jiangsuensis]|uniref:outer membrane protein assembly factor BamE n=1 Tax=Pseudoxanthomonas jiangsuensis TaxID=619688 RepID=UPI001391CE14|nr:outer membrane protein assembly factor BamE [Pseudoxanthomonas jiangsuensis]KAF1696695.1 hypothetical protein CSC62_08950 [Pseudoxanthomonas jiangsuensis]